MKASKLTSKYQATIPEEIRKKLRLKSGDSILFKVKNDQVTIEKAEAVDLIYLSSIEQSLSSEWNSPEDDEAFEHLQTR